MALSLSPHSMLAFCHGQEKSPIFSQPLVDVLGMKIKYVKAKNFLSIGKDELMLDFTKYGNVVRIAGKNGHGKSTLLEIVIYALYGKLIKKLSHKEAINNQTKKNLRVEIGWDDYRVVRLRKPDGLRFWRGKEELTLGGVPATQELINQAIGLNYETFVNVVFFGQHNQYAFLSCDAATKRNVVENLLGLEKYTHYCQVAKDKRKELENNVRDLVKDYERQRNNAEQHERRQRQLTEQSQKWHDRQEQTLDRLRAELNAKETTLQKVADPERLAQWRAQQAALRQTQSKRQQFHDAVQKTETEIGELRDLQAGKKTANHQANLQHQTIGNEIIRLENLLTDLDTCNRDLRSLTGTCPVCYGVVDGANVQTVLARNERTRQELQTQLAQQQEQLALAQTTRDDLQAEVNKVSAALQSGQERLKKMRLRLQVLQSEIDCLQSEMVEPKVDAEQRLLQERIGDLQKQIQQQQVEQNPYVELLQTTVQDVGEARHEAERLRTLVVDQERLLPYYDYWIKGFGDRGLRAFIVDGYVPALNARINYWLQFLIDNKIKLTFDNNLEETITSNPPNGDPFVYQGLSGSEHNRIDLAISQAFAYLMMLASGTCPSIVALDEVVVYQDRDGVACVHAMIMELARDRQVLVISHDPDLIDALDGCDIVQVEKVDGVTRIVQ